MRVSLITFIFVLFIGCSNEIDTSPKEVKWDRVECERCSMMLGDEDFAVQAISLDDGKAYFFDDIGCAVKWMSNVGNKVTLDGVKLYVRNAQNNKFIDATEAKYTTDVISPMGFNFLAHPKNTKLEKYITYSQVVQESLSTHKHKARN